MAEGANPEIKTAREPDAARGVEAARGGGAPREIDAPREAQASLEGESLRWRVSGRARVRKIAGAVVRWFAAGVLALWLLAALSLVALRWIDPPTTAVQMERRVESWSESKPYHKRYTFVPLSAISPEFQHAVIAAEDARFYQHHGFDWQAMEIAAEDDMQGGRRRDFGWARLWNDCGTGRGNDLQRICDVPTGLRFRRWTLYPTLKRGANDRCAYGAVAADAGVYGPARDGDGEGAAPEPDT